MGGTSGKGAQQGQSYSAPKKSDTDMLMEMMEAFAKSVGGGTPQATFTGADGPPVLSTRETKPDGTIVIRKAAGNAKSSSDEGGGSGKQSVGDYGGKGNYGGFGSGRNTAGGYGSLADSGNNEDDLG